MRRWKGRSRTGYKQIPTSEASALLNKKVLKTYASIENAPTAVSIEAGGSANEPEALDSSFIVNLIIMSLCTMCGDSSRGVCFPTLWLFVESMGGTHKNQGFAVALFSAGRIFSSPILGYYSSTWSYKWVLVISMCLMAFWKFSVHGGRQLVPSVHSTI